MLCVVQLLHQTNGKIIFFYSSNFDKIKILFRLQYSSCNTTPLHSPYTSPIALNREALFKKQVNMNYTMIQQSPNQKIMDSEEKLIDALNNNSISPSTFQNQIKNKLNFFKNNVFTTPKLGKKKTGTPDKQINDSPCSMRLQNQNTPQGQSQAPATPNSGTDPRSWYQRWNFRQNDSFSMNSTNSLNSSQEKEREFLFTINDRPLNVIKADLVHSFLSVSLIMNLSKANQVFIF